jgi:hypothetical protein
MSAGKRRPNAMLGFLKAFGMLFVMLIMLPVWFARGVAARASFRRELLAAGVSEETAWRLSDRYKIRLRDFAGGRAVVSSQARGMDA